MHENCPTKEKGKIYTDEIRVKINLVVARCPDPGLVSIAPLNKATPWVPPTIVMVWVVVRIW